MILLPEATYVLCAVTAFICVALLLRAYWRSGLRLLLWSAVCFIALAVENAILFADMVLVPDLDLQVWRNAIALLGLLCLLFGLIWHSRPAR